MMAQPKINFAQFIILVYRVKNFSAFVPFSFSAAWEIAIQHDANQAVTDKIE